MALTPFHIAVAVRNISEARDFYGQKLGFEEGRSAEDWIDFNMFGHQFVVHLDESLGESGQVHRSSNPVDNKHVPVPHCGVVLTIPEWEAFKDRVSEVVTDWVIEPYTRFAGQPGEQRTMFFLDPSGNALEFKAFQNIETELFKS